MKNYDVYFELYGKKLRTTIIADSEAHAQEIVKNKIIFHKVSKSQIQEEKPFDSSDIFESFKDIFGGKDIFGKIFGGNKK